MVALTNKLAQLGPAPILVIAGNNPKVRQRIGSAQVNLNIPFNWKDKDHLGVLVFGLARVVLERQEDRGKLC